MQLNYQYFESANSNLTPLVIVPGLFGSIANWRRVAKMLAAGRPVYVVDQRNHGRSPHSDSHSYADMVEDLSLFLQDREIESCHIAGHSMGGKVAMLLALEKLNHLASLCVLDIAPVTYSHSHAPFLEALLEVDLSNLESRAQADRALRHAIPDTPTRLFLLQSLGGSPGQYYWRINLAVLHQYMEQLVAFPDMHETSKTPALFLRGENSIYVTPEHHVKIKTLFSNSHIETVADAGHWLHAEQPKAVVAAIEKFLVL